MVISKVFHQRIKSTNLKYAFAFGNKYLVPVNSIQLTLYPIYRIFSLKAPKTRIIEFANRIDPDEAAHYEQPHLDLYCFLLVLNFQYDLASMKDFCKFCRRKFCHLLFGAFRLFMLRFRQLFLQAEEISKVSMINIELLNELINRMHRYDIFGSRVS